MLKTSQKWGRVVALALGLCAAAAQAVPVLTDLTVDFEDVSISGYAAHLELGYKGFTWGNVAPNAGFSGLAGNIFVQCAEAGGTDCSTLPGNNQYASTTGQNGAAGSYTIRRTDGSGFYFDGGDFWSRRGADAVGDFYFILYGQNGQTMYRGDNEDLTGSGKREKMVLSGVPTDMAPSFTDMIYGMSFIFDNDDYDHFAFDNLDFRVFVENTGTSGTAGAGGTSIEPAPVGSPTNTVPEPGTLALLGLGLGAAAWSRRRAAVASLL